MTDDDTITSTREYDDHDTPTIDPKRITKEAKRIREAHPLSPPEPAPTAPPEGGEEQSNNASDGEEIEDRYEWASAGA